MKSIFDLFRKRISDSSDSEQFNVETELTIEVYDKNGRLKCRKIIKD